MVDHLLQEVDADVRAERMHQLWARNRSKLLFLVVAILVATAGNSIWTAYEQKRGGELLLALTDAQALYSDGKFTEAAAAFETTATAASGDTQTLAQLWQGRALARAGKNPEAISVLKEASIARSVWGDLACLRLATLDAAAATCLSDTHDSPLAGQRQEWFAANLWDAGKKAEAAKVLEDLSTAADTTEASRAQLTQWLTTVRANPAAAQ